MKAYFVAAGIFFITFYAVFNGVQSIDQTFLQNARVLGASRLRITKEVYFPAILSWIIASLRLTAAWSLSSAVLVELLAANNGMGYVIILGEQTADVAEVLGGIIVISVVAVVIDRLLLVLNRHLTKWRLP